MALAPIEVFVFHAVAESYDATRFLRQDWTPTDEFETELRRLKKRYTFISLPQACQKLKHDLIRREHYAVLTCDDGFASVLDVLPVILGEQIPITLFINPKYLDGVSIREGYARHPLYITHNQLFDIHSPLVTVGMHGYEHTDSTLLTPSEFQKDVECCIDLLQNHPNYIPYYAYTWGRFNDSTQHILDKMGVTPLFCDGTSNWRYHGGISRRCIDSPGQMSFEFVNS